MAAKLFWWILGFGFSRLSCYVFCICLLPNRNPKSKSVELGDQVLWIEVEERSVKIIEILIIWKSLEFWVVQNSSWKKIQRRTVYRSVSVSFNSDHSYYNIGNLRSRGKNNPDNMVCFDFCIRHSWQNISTNCAQFVISNMQQTTFN